MAEAVRAQGQHHQPCGERRLRDDVRPEVERNAEREKGAVKRRAAELERVLEGAGEVTAGIIEHEGKAVGEGRPEKRGRQQYSHEKPSNPLRSVPPKARRSRTFSRRA